MSDDLKKALDTAMSRLASLEAEVSGYRSRAREPEKASFDPVAFRNAFVSDPVGTMTKMGAPVDHITRVLVANAMGDGAPPELKVLAAMGPQVSATHALDSKVETLSRQLSALVESQTKKGARESFQALATDKSKYPHLAKAYAVDSSLFDEDVSRGGNAEEIATALETRLKKVASVYAPPASEANADSQQDPSTQVKPALASTMSGDPPPPPKDKVGLFTQDDHARLRDEIIRKASSQAGQPAS